ncbi:hypothetical protein FJT64_022735 [Amphibalanus amphitrite]|uniref:Uncharacterized protein n=1 Tax=Amphibalanus amphitrite TaxID=1232801 RepID=A0A6A4WPP1_AMPAM|nr:hypothetical protein FJT64_022735 [Amphibalanus amphitrite]
MAISFQRLQLLRKTTTVKRQANSGSSYPTYTSVPKTSFSCDQFGPGYYADLETDCQVFVCDWWYNVDCGASDKFYSLNSLIGRESEAGERSSTAQTPQPQYQFDRVRAQLATLLEGVEPLDVPANQLDPQPASAAPGRVVFSARGQDQPEWLYALGGLVL